MELESLTIDGARAAMAAGETNATALAELHYARINSQDGRINSFLALSRERAMTQAAKIDAMAAKGEKLPVLAGIPLGIKDVLVMQGAPATAGSRILKGYRPPYDATVVAKLEGAGGFYWGS
jgi:aspartyl-tRNA(Asn)/glutamyl-tRNA(Gln) amidotransferase subunit A